MRFRTLKATLLAGVFAVAAAPAAIAQQAAQSPAGEAETAMPLQQPDNSWITMSGTVMSPTRDAFLLDYGAGQIIVEMDTWEGWAEAMNLTEGNKVTVIGRVDNDLLESATIEASAVVDEMNGQHYFADAADEEDMADWFATHAAAEGQTTMRGIVKKVNAEANEFMLDNGVFEVKVATENLDENPLDATGATQIKDGDIVSVSGIVENDLFEQRELQAMTVALLTPDNVVLEQSAQSNLTTRTASVVAGAPRAESEDWTEAEAANRQQADNKQSDRSVDVAANSAAEVNATLPAEVEAASSEEGYTTEDLAKAQLAAIRSAPPLNPS